MTTIVYQSIQFELLQKSIDDKYEKNLRDRHRCDDSEDFNVAFVFNCIF